MKTITETTIKEPVSMFDVIPNMKHLATIVRESPTSESAFRELALHGLDGEMKAGSIGTAASFLLGYASAHHTASKAERLERYKMMDEELAADVIEQLEHETKDIISILDKLKADIEKAYHRQGIRIYRLMLSFLATCIDNNTGRGICPCLLTGKKQENHGKI